MSSHDVIDADEGEIANRNGSRFNAVKHGLTAKTAVLPGEDPALFQAKIDVYKEGIGTRNGIEEDLAAKAALASWQMDRAVGVQVASVNCAILTKPAADRLRADLEAAGIGNRLLHDRRGPLELYGALEFAPTEQRTSWVDNPDDPDHPTILIRRLIATVSGCQWLQGQWRRLRENLKVGPSFQSHEKLLMLRLMGHQPINAVSRPEVARVFLACHVLGPQFPNAFEELRCEMFKSQLKEHKKLLERWDKTEITPKSRTAARAVLLGIIDEAIERLRLVEAELQVTADEVARQQQALLGHDEGKAGEQLRRHLGSCNRLIFGNLNAIDKLRRNEAEGWGRARQERARRKDERRSGGHVDDVLIVDERGTLRPAHSYDGNLEEGLARYEAQFGRSGLERQADSRNEIVETHVRAVPDFARWTPPVEDGGLGGDALPIPAGELGAGVGFGVEANAGLPGDGAAVDQDCSVTLMLTEQGRQSKIQNELLGSPLSVISGQSSSVVRGPLSVVSGRLDGGVCGGAGLAGAQHPWWDFEDADTVARLASIPAQAFPGGGGPRVARGKDGGPTKRRPSERFWKRDRKQWRKIRAKVELERRKRETDAELDDVPLEKMLDSVKRLLPNSVKVLRDHGP